MGKRTRDNIYPVTILMDRYTGTYSGGKWTAWNLEVEMIPEEVGADDLTCAEFWEENAYLAGIGSTPEEALDNLLFQLNKVYE